MTKIVRKKYRKYSECESVFKLKCIENKMVELIISKGIYKCD